MTANIRELAEDAIRQVRKADDFLDAVREVLPELFKLWQRHRRDVAALRKALRDLDASLEAGRTEVDAALDAKHGGDDQ